MNALGRGFESRPWHNMREWSIGEAQDIKSWIGWFDSIFPYKFSVDIASESVTAKSVVAGKSDGVGSPERTPPSPDAVIAE